MYVGKKRSLRLIEIQERVLPEEEWIIGISDPSYFSGVGFSMPLASGRALGLSERSEIEDSESSPDLTQSSNLDDPVKMFPVEHTPFDDLLPGGYNHSSESVQASANGAGDGPGIVYPRENIIMTQIRRDTETSPNLYAFVPGLFYCSGQQTSVDGVLIEVIQKDIFGITISDFRPEDVRAFDVDQVVVGTEKDGFEREPITEKTLGRFSLGPSALGPLTDDRGGSYSRNVEFGIALAKRIPLRMLKQAYLATQIMEKRLSRLLEDIEFFGLTPRKRIYVRNSKHPYGRVIDVSYRGLDAILTLEGSTGLGCPDEVDLEMDLAKLSFSKTVGSTSETGIEGAVLDVLTFIQSELAGRTERSRVLETLFREVKS
ncbi:MAG: hypothetical protein DRO87_12940 [Candidatus Thorarchaeota archaeon]|nr:MAG: hypothetical protein DRO87_12940 [Candidatus Thorarchaeota archaeon]RLI56348.1 MAG: hypothetical protein DRP09_06960 [Candidatus Thorarchaeota archaeon]